MPEIFKVQIRPVFRCICFILERSYVTGKGGAAWGMEYMKILELQCNYLIIS